jgi:hypothetical protein
MSISADRAAALPVTTLFMIIAIVNLASHTETINFETRAFRQNAVQRIPPATQWREVGKKLMRGGM